MVSTILQRLAFFLAALALTNCTTRAPEGSNCLFNDDCVEPLVCAGRFCRAQCASDRDCPPMFRCSAGDVPARRVCLPPTTAALCTRPEDCPPGASCAADRVCRWSCVAPTSCAVRGAGSVCQDGLCATPLRVRNIDDSADASTADASTMDAAKDGAFDTGSEVVSDAAPEVTPSLDAPDASNVAPFPSNESEGAFDPAPAVNDAGVALPTVVTLDAGVHHFTTVRIRREITLRANGTGELDLRATGPIVVEGTIDLSGGAGRALDGSPAADDDPGGGTGGGSTGTALVGAQGTVSACGAPGRGGRGASGLSAEMSAPNCGVGGTFGGGAGGATGRGGGGGGGYAGGGGGGGGLTSSAGEGGAGASAAGGNTGATGGRRGGGPGLGAEATLGVYAGRSGSTGNNAIGTCGGGGGGSIGRVAVEDLAVGPGTFYPGSGGGGGGGEQNGCSGRCRPQQGMGGGGGGGALRLASTRSITLQSGAALRANGGLGGTTNSELGGCPGGSGSGGVVYLSAPEIVCDGCALSATGGARVDHPYSRAVGGAGGLGRLRLSVRVSRCQMGGTVNPPMPAGGCVVSPPGGSPGVAYVGEYPD